MCRLLNKIKRAWLEFWREDENDCNMRHLSQSDKRSIWYGAFMMCMITVSLCCFVISASNYRVSRQNDKDIEEVMNTIGAYMAFATDDEYDEIAKTIRHDLILSEFGRMQRMLFDTFLTLLKIAELAWRAIRRKYIFSVTIRGNFIH